MLDLPEEDFACTDFERLVMTTPAPPFDPAMWQRAAAALADLNLAADTVLIGDSIAAEFPSNAALAALGGVCLCNLGVGGFRTQHVLWLLEIPEVANLRPATVLLLVGTNNISMGDHHGAIAAGIIGILKQAVALWNPPNLLLVQTIPRAPGLDFRTEERKAMHGMVRAASPAFAQLMIAEADETLNAHTQAYGPDHLHLTEFGYDLVADAISQRRSEAAAKASIDR